MGWIGEQVDSVKSIQFRQFITQTGMIVTSTLILWKGLMCVTGSESPVVVVFQEAWSLALRDQMRSPTMKVVLLNYRTNCTWEMQFLISQQWTIMNPVTRCLMELIQKPSFRSSSD
ncbi:uncharacterized protein LOC108203759 isoform X2 [Daucus carota subsp. sativus]|uniref:uncharacterized protein LOC108203759 isoform X2 n=1 Tax=Daucus carota subsp. sativus TaxID=79200 RepID=UPI0030833E04